MLNFRSLPWYVVVLTEGADGGCCRGDGSKENLTPKTVDVKKLREKLTENGAII